MYFVISTATWRLRLQTE